MAASPPPVPAAGRAGEAGGRPLRCGAPGPALPATPTPAGGGGWRRASGPGGINRRPGGSGRAAAGSAHRTARERPGSRRGGASRPLPSSPLRCQRLAGMEGKTLPGLEPPSPSSFPAPAGPRPPGGRGLGRAEGLGAGRGEGSASLSAPLGAPRPCRSPAPPPRRGYRRARGGEGPRRG